ncbi:MAG: hypothetical protein HZA61_15350 [Candidatus Eisenbacteria bacterium]|uniref:Flagellar protein FlgN n=1 Tax=Eiseniibacteriota bacterium TaxID=2212470 RepID=A0A933WC20_UNCEI|nr:hypothetical protein [Candidatus Eisenbacteria bacterium]
MEGKSRMDVALAELTRALERETGTVRELREALLRQRAGVAADSAGAVNESCDDIARLLVAIEAAKRHRAMRIEAVSPEGGVPLDSLERVLGPALPESLVRARAELRREAQATAREAAVNRTVLARTVEAGEAFLQALFSGANTLEPVYRAGERREEDGAGHLFDRKA